MPLTYDSLAHLLKSETQVQHQEAERLLYPKIDGISTVKDYSDLLKAFYGFYAPLEKNVQLHIDRLQLEDVHERRISCLIIDDLLVLGENVFEIPVCNNLPKIKNTAEAFGAMYVMEGSTLGGRMIRKMLLKKHESFLQPQHLNFFNGYGEATSAKWKLFQESLSRQQDTAAVVNAANQTFLLFQNWIKLIL